MVNGFDNNYWGWGCEDDDLKQRCIINGIKTDFRHGICNDLEKIPNNYNREVNPNYKNNLSKLQNFKKYGTKKDIENNGLKQSHNFYTVVSEKEYKKYLLLKCKTKQYT